VLTQFPRLVTLLESVPATLVHGDFYPDNMVFVKGQPCIFDWEEAALAAGELDIAALTHDWHDEVVQAAESAYRQARWPDGSPTLHADRLEAARIIVNCRLLGEAPGWPDRSTRRWRVELLRRSAQRLGIV